MGKMGEGTIYRISGPIVVTKDTSDIVMNEEVKIGDEGLIGEVIEINGEEASIQVYEETTGIRPGTKVYGTGSPLSVELGPGLISQTFDGIQRPLTLIKEKHGIFIKRGIEIHPLPRDRDWDVDINIKIGQIIYPNTIIGIVNETDLVNHKILTPPDISGKVIDIIKSSSYKVSDPICVVENKEKEKIELNLFHKWPVRMKRPVKKRINPGEILFTGQRVIDFIFPIAKGGVAAIPGGFGTGKTVTQHSLAKWADADIIIYIGCGERGNEMAQVLEEFPGLLDPRTNKSIMERTILIANTSNMPVTARESSIYTGITIAEYFRDMGYDVALMADSTSRWAEALREISGRMEEMPAERGYPAYLGSRLAEFYERAGKMEVSEDRIGSLSIIGAVSPPGGDFSEPVTTNTKRFVRAFWVLDTELAYSRHYPAISWTDSYSEYFEDTIKWWEEQGVPIKELRGKVMEILHEETELKQIVQLVGEGALPEKERLTLKVAELIREGFLQQNALSIDAYCSSSKQYRMIKIVIDFGEGARDLLERGVPLFKIIELPIFSDIKRMGMEIRNEEIDKFDELEENLKKDFERLKGEYG
jgi:V/A-type H+-transporting ATPase subunit A